MVATVMAAVLSMTNTVSYAADGDPTVFVADQAGAPRDMAQQLERLTKDPLGTLDKVMAVDTGGEWLTSAQVDALAAGGEASGVKVLGVMPGSGELLDTTMFDLSDGTYDGPATGEFATGVIFIYSVPGREWCLTMCMSTGRSFSECVRLKYVYG